ncbi:MAG: hypothetical protein Q8Q18_02175 [bacterium]|nr:hypothetical protein [bacterium]
MLFVPLLVNATDGVVLLEPTLLSNSQSESVTLSTYIETLVPRITAIASLIALVMFMIAGVMYASPIEATKSKGKEMATRALVGLLIVLASYTILNQINPALVAFNVDSIIPPLGTYNSPAVSTGATSSAPPASGTIDQGNFPTQVIIIP